MYVFCTVTEQKLRPGLSPPDFNDSSGQHCLSGLLDSQSPSSGVGFEPGGKAWDPSAGDWCCTEGSDIDDKTDESRSSRETDRSSSLTANLASIKNCDRSLPSSVVTSTTSGTPGSGFSCHTYKTKRIHQEHNIYAELKNHIAFSYVFIACAYAMYMLLT